MEKKRKYVGNKLVRRQLGGTNHFVFNKLKNVGREQSKRSGHPLRSIVRPKKYRTTSSSDVDQVNRKLTRNVRCSLDQTVDIEKDINEIRRELNINKENKANIQIESNCPPMYTNSSVESNPIGILYNPQNVTGAYEQCSSKKTYTDLLPLNSTSILNEKSLPNTSFCGPSISRSETSQITSTITSLHTAETLHGLSEQVPYVPTTDQQIPYVSSQISCIPTSNQQQDSTQFSSATRVGCYTNFPATRMHLNEYNYENDSHSGSRDKEMWHLLEKLNKVVVTKEEFRTLRTEFMEYHRIINNKLDRLLHKQSNIMPPKPPSFPLQSVQEVTNFNNISQEEYDNAVQYLHFIGGFTLHDTVKYCMKEVMTDDTIKHYSAWGERGNLPLFDTKVIKVIYDAVCMNTHFERPLRDEFFREIAEAVRFGKQRNRNMNKKANIIRGRGRRQRLRNEAGNHLLGELRDAHNVDNNDNHMDDADDGDFNEDNIDDGNSADNDN